MIQTERKPLHPLVQIPEFPPTVFPTERELPFGGTHYQPGMSLRQLYAAFAMQAHISKGYTDRSFIALESLLMADEMIKVEKELREKGR